MSQWGRDSGAREGSGPSPGAGLPERIGDRYVVKRLLGRGAQGAVYLAYDPNFEIDVAVKVLHPDFRSEEFVERFKIDAQVAVRLNAPNVVRVFDFDPHAPYLVMEYCGDGDLNRTIKSRQRRPLAEILGIVRQICEALVAAHEHDPPILHRDVKPGNVLFHKGVPKVADFGLAKVLGGGGAATTTRGMMGTVRYCSPEQIHDASRVDHRTDLWSVAVILYELLTWARPFDRSGDTFFNIAVRIQTEAPRQPPFEIPEPVLAIVLKALEKEPAKRFASAREMRDALNRALREVPGADRLLLPPEHAVDEVSRMAARVAEMVESERAGEAETLVQEMRRQWPDDSVPSFWHRRLTERLGRKASTGAATGSSAGVRDRSEWVRRHVDSVLGLMKEWKYREARQKVGEILLEAPDDTLVQGLLERVNEGERKLRTDLEQAHQEADRARAAGDYAEAHAVWKGLEEAYRGHPEVQVQLAVTAREVEIQERRRAREATEREASRALEAGDLRGAAEAWEKYVRQHPGDPEAQQSLRALQEALGERERAARLAEFKEKTANLRRSAQLEEALALWEAYLQQDPGAVEAVREAQSLRDEIALRRREESLLEARARSAGLVEAGDFRGAAGAWRSFLARYPDHDEAQEELGRLQGRLAEQERREALADLERIVSGVAAALESGRYRSVEPAYASLAQALHAARAASSGDAGALSRGRSSLQAAWQRAEGTLDRELAQARSRVQKRFVELREWLPGSDGRGTQAGSPGETGLRQALAEALGVLCTAPALAGSGDPLAPVLDAERRLEGAAAALSHERQAALAAAEAEVRQALEEAQSGVAALALLASAEPAPGIRPDALEERLGALRARSDSKVPRQLASVAEQARALRAEAEAARIVSEARLERDLAALLEEGRRLLGEPGSDRLETLVREGLQTLGGEGAGVGPSGEAPGAGPSREAPGALCQELRSQVASLRRGREERLARERERWQAARLAWQALRLDDREGDVGRQAEEAAAAGEAALAGGRWEELGACVERLEALTREGRLQSVWAEHAGAVARIEEALGGQRGSPAALESGLGDALARYRRALARGDVAEARALGSRLVTESGSLPEEDEEGVERAVEIPALSRRMRAWNERCAPGNLRAFERLAKQYESGRSRGHEGSAPSAAELRDSYRRLIQLPSPARPLAVAGAAAAALAAALVTLLLGPGGSHEVVVLSAAGEVEIADVRRDGSPVSVAPARVTEEGARWRDLKRGRYVVRTRGGGEMHFELPGAGVWVLHDGRVDYSRVLAEELGLREGSSSQ